MTDLNDLINMNPENMYASTDLLLDLHGLFGKYLAKCPDLPLRAYLHSFSSVLAALAVLFPKENIIKELNELLKIKLGCLGLID